MKMDAIITGESERVGLSIIDNNDVEHLIEMELNGQIKYHETDGYPDDPVDRTKVGNEHINQARRFAKYWVYRKRGYDTLDGWKNPDRITLAAIGLMALEASVAEEYLGELSQQLANLYTDTDPTVDVPEGVDPSSAVYRQDVYLGLDEEARSSYAAVLDEVSGFDLHVDGTDSDHSIISDTEVERLVDETDIDPSGLPTPEDGLFIEATSGVHIHWDDAMGQYHTQWGDQPDVDRDPDGRIELLAFEPDSIEELKRQAVRNLLCQVRDCYLAMGIAPPEQFRLLGHGRHAASTWYVHNDFYEDYYDPDANIKTWFEDHTPNNAYNTTVKTDEPAQTNN